MPAFDPLGAAGAAAAGAGAGAAAGWLPEPPRDAQPAVANATTAVAAHSTAGELILFPIEMLLDSSFAKRSAA